MNKTLKIVIIIFLVVDAAAILGYYGVKIYRERKSAPTFTTIDINKAVAEGTAPAGYPVDLPIPNKDLIDQKVIHYPHPGVTLTSITFTLGNTVEQTANLYRNYFYTHNYEATSTVDKQVVIFQASKAGSPATIVVTLVPQESGTSVSVVITTKDN